MALNELIGQIVIEYQPSICINHAQGARDGCQDDDRGRGSAVRQKCIRFGEKSVEKLIRRWIVHNALVAYPNRPLHGGGLSSSDQIGSVPQTTDEALGGDRSVQLSLLPTRVAQPDRIETRASQATSACSRSISTRESAEDYPPPVLQNAIYVYILRQSHVLGRV